MLEAGRPAEAIAPLREAIARAPDPTLIRVMLGQALIATNNPKLADEAVQNLEAAIIKDPDIPDAYTNLAMAYGRKGDSAMPTSPRRKQRSRAAISAPRGNSRYAPRRVFQSARRDG